MPHPNPSDALLPPHAFAPLVYAHSRTTPPLMISVTDPVKREQTGMFGFKGSKLLCVRVQMRV